MGKRAQVGLLLTGNELMSGDTVDSNSSRIALALSEKKIGIAKKITVGDEPQLLAESLRNLCTESHTVVINGGLGPTEDDLTAAVVAEVLGRTLGEHPGAPAHLAHG